MGRHVHHLKHDELYWTRRSNKADEKRRKLKLRELKSYKTGGERKEKKSTEKRKIIM